MAVEGIMLRDSTNIVTTTLASTALYGYGGSGQYLLVTQSTTADFVVKLATSAVSVRGVLQNKPAAGQAADIAIVGISKVVAGTTIAAGDLLYADANGRVQCPTAGSTGPCVGIALSAAAAADAIITMHINDAALKV